MYYEQPLTQRGYYPMCRLIPMNVEGACLNMKKGSQSSTAGHCMLRRVTDKQSLLPLVALAAALGATGVSAADETSATPQLAPVTVTATMNEHEVRTAPASVTVIPRAELEVRNPDNLLDAVRGEPGVTLSPASLGGRKTISIRGMEGRHVLTMIDGQRISATDDAVGHSDYQYSWLPMSAVERVEIIRGPMSTLYGSEALGGVVNLITRRPTDHWEGSVSLKGTMPLGGSNTDPGGSASFYAAGPAGERLSLRAYGVLDSQASVANPDDKRVSEIEGSTNQMGGLGATLKLTTEQNLDFNFRQGHEERFYDALSGAKEYENRYEIDRTQADIAWRGDFGAWRGQLRVYQSEIDIRNSRSNGVKSLSANLLRDRVIDGNASTTFGSHTLTAGSEWREEYMKTVTLQGGGGSSCAHGRFFTR